MPLTVTVDTRQTFSLKDLKCTNGTITWDSSYLTAGEVLTPSDVGLAHILFIDVAPLGSPTTSWNYSYNHAGRTLSAFETGAADNPEEEVASTTDISAVVCRYFAIGY